MKIFSYEELIWSQTQYFLQHFFMLEHVGEI